MPNISSPFEYKKLILNDRNTPEINNAPVDYQTLLLTDQETPKTDKQLKKTTNTEPKDYSIQGLITRILSTDRQTILIKPAHLPLKLSNKLLFLILI